METKIGFSELWFNSGQPSVSLHIETNHLICIGNLSDWFLSEMQRWAEMA